ncbi:hypothetical protein ABN702_00785 [Bacillus haimaensis]|uniref:hypothetical protein n=1 Tax=Bacillus haimaensis TaxID=3160967 RepID=UPI003AA9CFBD
MYERVENFQQQQAFESMWEHICKKNKWMNDPYDPQGIRYNLLLLQDKIFPFFHKKKIIGTIEFLRYNPESPYCTVEGPGKYCFSELKGIKQYQDRVWEIDKLCLSEKFQHKGYFTDFFHVFEDHILTYRPKFYIGLMEKKFFQMMQMKFGLAIESKAEMKGPGTSLMAVIFDVEKLMNDTKKVETLKKLARI